MTGTTPLSLSPFVERLRPLLTAEPLPIYFVGGTVRDALLGRAIHDIDLAVEDDAIPLTFRLADKLGLPAYILDAERGVGRILAADDNITLDIARFRGQTLDDDLHGRDFTVNALALPPHGRTTDDIIDLHNGRDDLQAGRIQIVNDNSIIDDPVRALRAARFAVQLGFTLTADTIIAAREAGPTIPTRASAERVRDELSRLLMNDAPHHGLTLLDELALLPFVLPQIAALAGIAQSAPHHEDVLAHTLSVLRYLVQIIRMVDQRPVAAEWGPAAEAVIGPYHSELREHLDRSTDGGTPGRLLLMWGGLLHDVGKRETQTIDAGGRIRFLCHDDMGAEITARTLSAFAFSNEAVRRVRNIVAGHMRPLYLATENRPPSRRTAYRYFRTLREAGLDVCLLSLADHLATYDGIGDENNWSALLMVVDSLLATYLGQYEQIVAPPRLIDGRVVMDLLETPPGQEIGRLLRLLEEAQAVGDVTTREEAIDFVRRHHVS